MRKPDFNLPVHSGKLFTWKGNKGSCEVSDLGRRHTGRVWNDACDVGFLVESSRTGVRKLFTYHAAIGPLDDVQGFVYCSEDGITITVFND